MKNKLKAAIATTSWKTVQNRFALTEQVRKGKALCQVAHIAWLYPGFGALKEVLLDYQFVMNSLLRKVSNLHILKSRTPKVKLYVQVCSIDKSFKSFKSQPYLTSHMTRTEKTLKLTPIDKEHEHTWCYVWVLWNLHYHKSYAVTNTHIYRLSTSLFLFSL